MSSKYAISIQGVSKQYKLGGKSGSFRDSFRSLIQSPFQRNNETFWALHDISFDIEQGEVVGIIGRNGAGKSTLLKILSRITKPSQGRIEINGKTAALLEAGTGFHPELTGRENIFLNGTILGMTRREIKTQLDAIVDFSGVERFIDTPVKHYSSGMYVRLGFAIAAHLEPEILIIDEVLAVGDTEFQKKCLGKMQDVSKSGRTVLFVSHNMSAVRSLCNRGVVLEKGQITYQGTSSGALDFFSKLSDKRQQFFDTSNLQTRKRGLKQIYVASIEFDAINYLPNSPMTITVRLDEQEKQFKGPIDLCLYIYDSLRNVIYQLHSRVVSEKLEYKKPMSLSFQMNTVKLTPGRYFVGVWLGAFGIEQDYCEEDIYFDIEDGSIFTWSNYENKAMVFKEFDMHEISH